MPITILRGQKRPDYYTDPSHFAHLHVHDEYSLLDGFAHVEEYAEVAVQRGYKHLCITNHGILGQIPRQYTTCQKNYRLIPIYGCEIYVNDHIQYHKHTIKEGENLPLPPQYSSVEELKHKYKKSYHLTLLAKNKQGYANLLKITSEAWINGYFRRPRVPRKYIQQYSEGLICGTACRGGLIGEAILDKEWDLAKEHLQWIKNTFKDFFVEMMLLDDDSEVAHPRTKSTDQETKKKYTKKTMIVHNQLKANLGLLKIMDQFGINKEEHLVLTNDSHYVNETDAFFQNIMLLLQRKNTFMDVDRDLLKSPLDRKVFQFDSDDLWYKTTLELDAMYEFLCNKYPSFKSEFTPKLYKASKLNTIKYASLCEHKIDIKGQTITWGVPLDRSEKFPEYHPNESREAALYNVKFKRNANRYLRYLAYLGLEKRGLNTKEYIDRIEKELAVIEKKNFSDYFLIVRGIVEYAKSQNICVGPGRGCFVPGTPVTLASGQSKAIEDIVIDDIVKNHYFDKTTITNTFFFNVDEELVQLELENSKIITCTHDHLFLTQYDGMVSAGKLCTYHKLGGLNEKTSDH